MKKCPPPLARHVPRSGSPLKPACRGLLLTSHHFSDIFLGGPNPQKQQKRPQKGAKRIETGSRSSSHVHHQLHNLTPPTSEPGLRPGSEVDGASLWSWRCPFDSDRRRTTFSQTAASPRFGKKWRSSSPSLTPPPAQEGTNATLVLPGGRDKYQRFFPLGGDSNRSILPGGEYVGRVETFKT